MTRVSRLSSFIALALMPAFWLPAAGCERSAPTASAEVLVTPSGEKTRNAKFSNPQLDADDWVSRFSSPRREIFGKRDAITAALTLAKGQSVADVGAGTGIFTERFAEVVGPTGKVYAVEVAAPFVAKLRETFKGVSQVEVVAGATDKTTLGPNSVDVAFVADTWHHFDEPEAMARDLADIIKPGGHLVVIDLEKLEGLVSDWQFGHVHEPRDAVIATLRAHGFSKGRLLGEAGLSENWAVELVRDSE